MLDILKRISYFVKALYGALKKHRLHLKNKIKLNYNSLNKLSSPFPLQL